MKQRIVALATGLVLILSAATVHAGAEGEAAAGEDPTRISYLMSDGGRYQTDATLHIPLTHLAEKFNIEWDLIVVPGSDYMSKLQVTLASGDLPDLMIYGSRDWPTRVNTWGEEGFFLDFAPRLADMPNLVKNFYAQRPHLLKNSLTDNGQLFYIGRLKTTTADNFSAAFSYRKDVFDQHGLQPPETFDEMRATLTKLKQIYPETAPFSVSRGLSYMLTVFDSLFETGRDVYFDFWDSPGYKFGPIEDNYRTLLEFFNGLHDVGLLNPENVATVSSRAPYQKLAVNNQIFMGVNSSYMSTENITKGGQAENDNTEFNWFYGPFPSYDAPGRIDSYLAVDSGGKLASAKTEHADMIAAVLDYMATPEYTIVQVWGNEGETFVYDSEGNPQYTEAFQATQAKWDRGLEADVTAILGYQPGMQELGAPISAEMQLKYYDNAEGIGSALPQKPAISFTEEEGDALRELAALDTYVAEMAFKFVSGDASFDEWDAYVRKCQDLGADRKVAIYNGAYARYTQRDGVTRDLLKNLGY
jgi:putative aldouronate transport system substrate-binding protein